MTTKNVAAAVEFARENQGRFVEELKALLRIPSVSTAPEHAWGCAAGGGVCGGGVEADWDGACAGDRDGYGEASGWASAGVCGLAACGACGRWEGQADGALLWALRCAAGGAAG